MSYDDIRYIALFIIAYHAINGSNGSIDSEGMRARRIIALVKSN